MRITFFALLFGLGAITGVIFLLMAVGASPVVHALLGPVFMAVLVLGLARLPSIVANRSWRKAARDHDLKLTQSGHGQALSRILEGSWQQRSFYASYDRSKRGTVMTSNMGQIDLYGEYTYFEVPEQKRHE